MNYFFITAHVLTPSVSLGDICLFSKIRALNHADKQSLTHTQTFTNTHTLTPTHQQPNTRTYSHTHTQPNK